MPHALTDVLAVTALGVMLVVAFVHPPAWVEALVAVAAAGGVVLLGLAPRAGVTAEVTQLLPVVVFLMAVLLVAEVCAAEGVFAWVGDLLSRRGDGRPVRLLGLTFVAAAVTTAVLSLDATVVLLTPVVVATAAGTMASPRPMVYACVRLANSASLLLPVSNLTNLLAMPALGVSLGPFALVMAPVWLVVLAVEYVGHRMFFRDDLAAQHAPVAGRPRVAMPRFPLVVVAVMLAGFAATSPLGIAPAWTASAAAVALTAHALRRGVVTLRSAAHALHPTFAVYVLCLGVVVVAVSHSFLGGLVADALPHVHSSAPSLGALLALMLTATLLANLVNNLPATLLLVPLVAPLGLVAVLATLIGLNVGSNLAYTGSLANLLWRRTLVRRGMPPSTLTFHRLSATVTLPAAGAAVVVLWLWAPVLAA